MFPLWGSRVLKLLGACACHVHVLSLDVPGMYCAGACWHYKAPYPVTAKAKLPTARARLV